MLRVQTIVLPEQMPLRPLRSLNGRIAVCSSQKGFIESRHLQGRSQRPSAEDRMPLFFGHGCPLQAPYT